MVGTELAPLVSSGGLADVLAALPAALRELGADVRIVMPAFRQIPHHQRGPVIGSVSVFLNGREQVGAIREALSPPSGVPLYLIEHEGYYGREALYGSSAHEYHDNPERFAFFCHAVLQGIPMTGWKPDVVQCHDWHTSIIPLLLKMSLAEHPFWQGTRSLFTIHNIAFQGRYSADRYGMIGLDRALFDNGTLEYEGDFNLMKGAIQYADALNTVSPRYAREIQTIEYGCGLHGLLAERSASLYGILNGVDYRLWNPAADPELPARYDHTDVAGKALCKQALQRAMRLPVKQDAPLIGIVSRLYWQKGIDLMLDALPALAEMGYQIAVLGAGDHALERRLEDCIPRFPGQVGVYLGYNAALSHLVFAGSDFFLMPSRYEPCGLTQMYALAYGSIPIVRRTGGLADTVVHATDRRIRNGTATGISFVPKTSGAIIRAAAQARDIFSSPETHASIMNTGMRQRFSWERSAREYLKLYERITS